MALRTFARTSPDKNEWFDWVDLPSGVALVDMHIYNRGYNDATILLALASKQRGQLHPPENVTAERVGAHEDGDTGYTYVVTALDKSGETLVSAEVTVENCRDEFNEENYVRIAWDSVDGAQAYRIYGRTVGALDLIAQTSDVQYEDQMRDHLGGLPPMLNTTGLLSRIFEGELESQEVLEVVGRKFLIDVGTKLIAYTNEDEVDFIAFGAEA